VSGAAAALEAVARDERGRIVASLARATRDLDLAEEAVGDALAEAVRTWERDGAPRNPAAWLTAVARRRAIDRLRTDAQLDRTARAAEAIGRLAAVPPPGEAPLPDERLELLFACCHPGLALDAQSR